MSKQQLMRERFTASLTLRSPLSEEQNQKGDVRHYGQCTFASALAAAVQIIAAVTAVTWAFGRTYPGLIFPPEFPKHAPVCRVARVELSFAHMQWSAVARRLFAGTADAVHDHTFGLVSLPPRYFCSLTFRRRHHHRDISASNSGIYLNNSDRSIPTGNARKRTSLGSTDVSKSINHNNTSNDPGHNKGGLTYATDTSSAPAEGNFRHFGILPAVIGALAARPLHLRDSMATETEEQVEQSETTNDEVIHGKVKSHKKRRSLSSSIVARRRREDFFGKAMRLDPLTAASLAAAVFSAGMLMGGGIMAYRAIEKREKAAAAAQEGFTQDMAANVERRAVERDKAAEGYAVYTRQMWTSMKILAATILSHALQTVLFTYHFSPVLFLIADSGFKAGIQAWAGGSNLSTVLHHMLVAGGYASVISMLGSWQMLLLPLGVYMLMQASGKGLTTKDSATSGAVFSENLPLIESRLKAEKNPEKRAALAEKLMESVARELKHKQLLDEGMRSALSRTLAQLRSDLLRGTSVEASCLRAHKKFNKILSLKFVQRPAPAPVGAAAPPPPRKPPTIRTSTAASAPQRPSPQGNPAASKK